MGNPANRAQDETEQLRQALDEETRRSIEIQRRLGRANAEFEEFVSMAAHNLRESLRDVAAFSQLMAETYAGRLDSDAGVYFERIQEGAARMQSLLGEVVDYWSTGTNGAQFSRVDMEAVLGQAVLPADQPSADRNAIVTHDPLPPVWGDFPALTKVLRHLIRNAIEYCEAPPARIHIAARLADREWVFSVKDNGPGIDRALQGRLFAAFKRLHGKEYPGNGLGLAFCKRAIEWQGGRMWMESAPGTGSTFFFTLPPAD